MEKTIRKLDVAIKRISREELSKACLIVERANESAKALLKAFDEIRKSRGGSKGATTDEEQDLLRSMLVLVAAGLDSMTKRVICDVLPVLAEIDPKVQQGIETFVSRQLRSDLGQQTAPTATKFLVKLLIAESHRKQVISEYINDLTGGSLQSPEELMKAMFALGLDPTACNVEPGALRKIFDIRNKIIHELDINFSAPRRRRHSRSRSDMIEYANKLLEVSEKILLKTNEKIIVSKCT